MDKLNDNIDVVRELKVGWADLIYLVNCVLGCRRYARRVFLAGKKGKVKSSFVKAKITVRALPPMTKLTKIEFSIRHPEPINKCPYYPVAYNDPSLALVWIN